MSLSSIYYFNSEVALHDMKVDADGAKLFFYDGEALKDAPSNCINVPINQFFDYFLKTTYPQISQLNFDATEFSDDTKSQITQSITQTITAIKNQKMEILNTLLQAEITDKNVNIMIYTFLKYLLENEIDSKIVVKLIYITEFLKSNIFKLDEISKILISQLSESIKEKIDMHNINLEYILEFLSDENIDIDKLELKYLQQIAKYRNLDDICTNLFYVQQLFTNKRHLDYITLYAKVLFTDEFFTLNIIEQKERVYKIFYCNNTIFNFGNNYKELYKLLYPIFLQAIEKEQDELVMFLYYPLQYSWNALSQTQEEFAQFNDEIELKLESFIKNKLISKYDIKPNSKKIDPNQKKIKVAFLIYRAIGLSVDNTMNSLLKFIKDSNNEKYEFTVYDLNFKEIGGSIPEEVKKLKDIGIKYVDLHQLFTKDTSPFYPIINKCLKIRKYIMKENIDILIGYHSRAEYNFLFTTRTTPKQIYWSHGNHTYDINEIDTKITHCGVEEKFNFETFTIPVNKNIYTPDIDMKLVEEIKNSYPKDSFILGTIGRLIKVDSNEYLETVASIMKENPNTIYLACGGGNNSSIKMKVEKLGISDRFFFTGHVDAHIYGHVIDLWLNTFPFGGGASLNERMYKKKPYITLWKTFTEEQKNKKDYIKYSRYIWPYTKQQYIDFTKELIEDKKLLKDVTNWHYNMLMNMQSNSSKFIDTLGY